MADLFLGLGLAAVAGLTGWEVFHMLLLNLVILIFLAFCAYKLIIWSIEAVKMAHKQAAYLEQQFGRDVIGAAKFVVTGSKREHDDG